MTCMSLLCSAIIHQNTSLLCISALFNASSKVGCFSYFFQTENYAKDVWHKCRCQSGHAKRLCAKGLYCHPHKWLAIWIAVDTAKKSKPSSRSPVRARDKRDAFKKSSLSADLASTLLSPSSAQTQVWNPVMTGENLLFPHWWWLRWACLMSVICSVKSKVVFGADKGTI